MPHCSGAEMGGQASAAGTLRCKVIAPALGHRAPGFPHAKDWQTGKPVPGCCGVGLKILYVNPGGTPGAGTLSALHQCGVLLTPRAATYCIMHPERKAVPVREGRACGHSKTKDRGENLGRHETPGSSLDCRMRYYG